MESNLINVNPQMQKLAENAVTTARDKFGVSLDFTENSLPQLEILLQQAHEGYEQGKSSGNWSFGAIDNTVRVWGSYLGEVIRRSLGGHWIVDQKSVFLQIESRTLDPIGQVRSRIVEGPQYHVQSFFQGLKSGIQNNQKEQAKYLISENSNPQFPLVEKKSKNRTTLYIIGIFGTLFLVLFCIIGIWILFNQAVLAVPRLPATMVPAVTDIPDADIGRTSVRQEDGMEMVYVPAGEFTMGSTSGYADEQPVHNVILDAFWIDRTEVTNVMYKLCVQAGACQLPVQSVSNTRTSYYGNSQYADYPVIYVTWNQADTYCNWAGARLPTEAEWEKVARGTDERIYPWGNNNPNNRLLNYNWNVMDTTVVGNYPSGASPYGAQDMAGNVTEWVNDWYSDTYYSQSPPSNPTGPVSGQYRVLRGGAWLDYDDKFLHSASRNWVEPDYGDSVIGFRCVLSP